jgi:hypothetical protein
VLVGEVLVENEIRQLHYPEINDHVPEHNGVFLQEGLLGQDAIPFLAQCVQELFV